MESYYAFWREQCQKQADITRGNDRESPLSIDSLGWTHLLSKMEPTQPSSRRHFATSSTSFILLSLLHLLINSSQAFLVTHQSHRLTAAPKLTKPRTYTANPKCQIKHLLLSTSESSGSNIGPSNTGSKKQLEHTDIEWRLRPPEGTSRIDRLKLKVGANILRLDAKLRGQKMPPILCPRGGQAVLEAYYKGMN